MISNCVFSRSKFITYFGILILIYNLFYDNPSFPQVVRVLNNLLLMLLFFSDSQQGGSLISKVSLYHFIISGWMFPRNLKSLFLCLIDSFRPGVSHGSLFLYRFLTLMTGNTWS